MQKLESNFSNQFSVKVFFWDLAENWLKYLVKLGLIRMNFLIVE